MGKSVEEFWSGALSGGAATIDLRRFETDRPFAWRGGEAVDQLDDASRRSASGSLAVDFALAASRMAVADAGLTGAGLDAARMGVCFGTVMATRPAVELWLERGLTPEKWAANDIWMRPESISEFPARELGFGGLNCVLSTACAAGNSAIAYAADALSQDRADLIVAGGADELSQAMLAMFDSFRALSPDVVMPFDRNRRGLLLAEGAGALVLEREQDAIARNARVYGHVLGFANVADAHHITAPDPGGHGAVRAMSGAIERAGVSPADVGYISAHGTGTPSNDLTEARAIRSVFGGAADGVPVSSLKGALGHAQGAASAIEAIGCLMALRDGVVPPTANHEVCDPACHVDVVSKSPRQAPLTVALNNAFGFGGNIECVVFGSS